MSEQYTEKLTTCECCPNQVKESTIKKYKTMLMCPECYDKEKSLEAQSKAEEQNRVDLTKSPLDKREQFFNAEKADLALIEGTKYERALKIKERIDSWSAILFEGRTRQNADQQALIDLCKELRVEEVLKLGIVMPNYNPQVLTVKKKVVERASKEDKALQNMARIIFGKKLSLLDSVNAKCHTEHNDWWDASGNVKSQNQGEYEQYILNNGAMLEKQAIEQVKTVVRSSRAQNIQEIAEGSRTVDGEKK